MNTNGIYFQSNIASAQKKSLEVQNSKYIVQYEDKVLNGFWLSNFVERVYFLYIMNE